MRSIHAGPGASTATEASKIQPSTSMPVHAGAGVASVRRPALTPACSPDAPPRRPRRRRPLRRFPAEILSPDEVLRLIAAVKGPAATAARNRAILALVYRSGLRISEALALCPKDLDFGPFPLISPARGVATSASGVQRAPDEPGDGAACLEQRPVGVCGGSIRVLHGKGGRARTVGIDAGALAIVAEWIEHRRAYAPSVGNPDRRPLFCTRSGRRVTTAYIRRMLPRLADLAGIARRVHAHGLRHTHAAELRAEGIDIGIISKQLGHVSIATTIRYLDHIAPMAVIEAVGGRRWSC